MKSTEKHYSLFIYIIKAKKSYIEFFIFILNGTRVCASVVLSFLWESGQNGSLSDKGCRPLLLGKG